MIQFCTIDSKTYGATVDIACVCRIFERLKKKRTTYQTAVQSFSRYVQSYEARLLQVVAIEFKLVKGEHRCQQIAIINRFHKYWQTTCNHVLEFSFPSGKNRGLLVKFKSCQKMQLTSHFFGAARSNRQSSLGQASQINNTLTIQPVPYQ